MQPIAKENSLFIPVLLLDSMWYNMNGALPCWFCSSKKEEHKENPTRDPKHLEVMAPCQGWALFPEIYWSKISDLIQWTLKCSMVRLAARVDIGVCTCEEEGRQLSSRSHLQQLMWFWPFLWKGSMENEHGNACAAWLLVVFIYCIQLYLTSHTGLAIITVVSMDFVMFNFSILMIVLCDCAVLQLLLINSWAAQVKYSLEAQNIFNKNNSHICLKNQPF